MSADLAPPRRPDRHTGPTHRLRRALDAMTDGMGKILHHREKPWASITFAGVRHDVHLRFEGTEAVAVGEAFIAALPDHEFTLPGQIMADAAITQVDHGLLPAPRLDVYCELLLLEDA